MGHSSSFAELAGKLAKAGTLIAVAEREAVTQAALLTKRSVQAQLVAAGAGSGRLRGVGKAGATIGVRYDLVGEGARVRMTGPAHLLERDTKAHDVTPRNRRAILTPDGPRARVHTKGTKGKYPFAKGVAVAAPQVPAVMAATVTKSLRKVF